MSLYYTYLIKCIPTGELYYGVRYSKKSNPNDLWKTYFTSSKIVEERIKKFGKENFLYQIRKTFDSPDKAREWEKNVITRMNLVTRIDFLNQSNGINFINKRKTNKNKIMIFLLEKKKYKFVSSEIANKMINEKTAIKKGIPKSNNTKKKISEAHRGKIKSENHKEKITISLKAKDHKTNLEKYGERKSIEISKKLSIANRGRLSPNKGKTYEELYGVDKAKELKKMRSENFIDNNPGLKMKGKTYEELYGVDKAKELKKTKKGGIKNKKIYNLYQNDILIAKGDRIYMLSILYSITGVNNKNALYNKNLLNMYNLRVLSFR